MTRSSDNSNETDDAENRIGLAVSRVAPRRHSTPTRSVGLACETVQNSRSSTEREREKKMIFNAPQQYPRNRTSLKKKTLKNKAKTYFQKKMQTPYLI